LDEQKRWLDQELERILEQRKQTEELQKVVILKQDVMHIHTCTISLLQELEKREDIIAKKEAMLAERSELEIKKLRSSQILNKVCLLVLSPPPPSFLLKPFQSNQFINFPLLSLSFFQGCCHVGQ
jgi:hypothetical protein